MTNDDELTGGCACGAVRYEIAGEFSAYCCHCRDCQKQSSSAFGISVPVMESSFTLQGDLRCWTRQTDSGSQTDCYFCPTCGVRIYHSGHNRPGMITVKGGTLDDPSRVKMLAHIWTASKQDWLIVDDGLPQLQYQPKTIEEWMQLLSGHYVEN